MVTDHIDSFAPEMSSQGLQSPARNSSEVSSILTGQISSTLHPISVKLERNNYTIWRSQVLPAARAHRLDQILIGKLPKPPRFSQSTSVNSSQPASNPEYDQWVILDQFLLSWILASISEAMYGHVVNCQTSAEVWSVLEKLFVSDSKARTLQLRFMLQ